MRTVPAAVATVLAVLMTVLGGNAARATPAQHRQPPIRAVSFQVDASVPSDPMLPAFCPTPRNNSSCGNAVVTLTLKGFRAYGGIKPCPSSGCTYSSPVDQGGGIGESGSARLAQIYRCGTSGALHVLHRTLPARIIPPGIPTYVNELTRVDDDTARVQTIFNFPSPFEYSPCPRTTQLVATVVFDVVVPFKGSHGVPDRVFRFDGVVLGRPWS